MSSFFSNKKGAGLFLTMIPVGIVMLSLITISRGFSIWLLSSLLLWIAYLFNIKKSLSMKTFSFSKMILFGIVVILLSFLIIDKLPNG